MEEGTPYEGCGSTFTMEQFAQSVNRFLEFREYDILPDNGKVSKAQAEAKYESLTHV